MNDQPPINTNRNLQRKGLSYWAPGPIPGTLWAVDDNGLPQLVDDLTLTTTGRERCKRLAEAHAHPGHRLVFSAGAYAYGIAIPHGSGWTIVPFHWSTPVRDYNATWPSHEDLRWRGMPTRGAVAS